MLARLAPSYYKADFGPAQAEALFEAFVEDLAEFEISDIHEAVTGYRRNEKNKFFPSSAALRKLAQDAARERYERARPRGKLDPNHVLRRPSFWWLLPNWNSQWQYEEIPHEFRAAFDRHMAREGRPKTYKPEPIVSRP